MNGMTEIEEIECKLFFNQSLYNILKVSSTTVQSAAIPISNASRTTSLPSAAATSKSYLKLVRTFYKKSQNFFLMIATNVWTNANTTSTISNSCQTGTSLANCDQSSKSLVYFGTFL